jgi:hypothetical protein
MNKFLEQSNPKTSFRIPVPSRDVTCQTLPGQE